jgi:DNA-binding MarR family transcriptional regulator
VTPSTTTALCDRLVQKGLISRRRRGTDRRSIYLIVSAKGHEQLEKIAARRGDLLREILVRLPVATQAQLAEAIPAFIEAAGDVDIDEWSMSGRSEGCSGPGYGG